MHAPSVLVFDLGGVLIHNDGWEVFQRISGLNLDAEAMKTRWLASSFVRGFETGRTDAEAFARGVLEEFEIDWSPARFLAEFETWPKDFYPGALELVASLRKHYRVCCLSNSNELHWPKWPLAELFDHCFGSHLIGQVKPDAGMFTHVCETLDAPPTALRFFDDARTNVDAATAFGLDAHHTVGFEAVRAAVDRLGL